MKRTILFVDDEPRLLRALKNSLRKQRREWDMHFAAGGDEALEVMASTPIDVIISDMRMPGMDGATLLSEVKTRYPRTVRVILSGHTEQHVAFRALPVTHQFLSKPCPATELVDIIRRTCRLHDSLQDDELTAALGGIHSLPSVPELYQKLNAALADPDVDLRVIAELVEQDPAIAPKILQLVNSAFFGLPRTTTSIRDATSYLGIDMIKSLVLSVEVFSLFESDNPLAVPVKALQQHALTVARLAVSVFPGHSMAGDVFAAGILHDIGLLAMAVARPEMLQAILERSPSVHDTFVAECELMLPSHAKIGAYMLGIWGLPYSIVEAVADHHTPPDTETFSLPFAIAIAEALLSCPEGPEKATLPEAWSERLARYGCSNQLDTWRAEAVSLL